MLFRPLDIEGVILVEGPVHVDERGIFCETWQAEAYGQAGLSIGWVQDNLSRSSKKNTIRGLHWQTSPAAQAKLVRVIHGAILDVVVDLRRASPTFGQWLSVELHSDKNEALLVPVGFAHGFCTLLDETVVTYKVSAPYAHDCERGLAWNCPELAIDWALQGQAPTLSPKDSIAPVLARLAAEDLF